MPTFTWVPTYDATKTITPNVDVIKFGGGYEQRQGRGINQQARKLSLTFRRPKTEIEAIDTFLKARGAIEAFDYVHSGQTTGKYVCREWTRTNIAKGIDGLSATFEEVFE